MKREARDNRGGKYYVISNPLPINENTGNFVVGQKELFANDKDFLFEWKNPNTGKLVSKVLPKEYVVAHIKQMPKWQQEEFIRKNKHYGMYWMITYKDIMSY